jgi:hypothetical protein
MWRVPVFPPEVTTGMEVSVDGTVMVVVPPLAVRTCEMTGDEATETVWVPPYEVTTVAELTETSDDGVETNDEAETGREMVAPCGVVRTSVTYGDETPGV